MEPQLSDNLLKVAAKLEKMIVQIISANFHLFFQGLKDPTAMLLTLFFIFCIYTHRNKDQLFSDQNVPNLFSFISGQFGDVML